MVQDLYIHQRPEVLESLRQAAVIESSESSNRLEGIIAPRERIEALVLRPTEPRDRSEQEIAGFTTFHPPVGRRTARGPRLPLRAPLQRRKRACGEAPHRG